MNLTSYAGFARFLLSLVAILAVAPAASGSDEPLLLVESWDDEFRTWWIPASSAPAITGVPFFLSYRNVVTNQGGGLKIDETALAEAIGGDLVLTNGQVGVFDFAATNCQAFAGFVARLTDSVEDTIIDGHLLIDSERVPWDAYYGPQNESDLWASSRSLRGCTIKFFRLIVSTLEISTNAAPIGGGDEFRIMGKAQWLIYGYPPPMPTKLCVSREPLGGVTLSWPTKAVGFSLQGSKGLGFPMTNVSSLPVVIGTNNTVVLPASETAGLFRLVYPPE